MPQSSRVAIKPEENKQLYYEKQKRINKVYSFVNVYN